MNYGPAILETTTPAPISFLSKSLQAAAAAAAAAAAGGSTQTARDSILQEAFELHNLQTQSNSSLLEFGLNLGFIERRSSDGRLTIDSLNAFPMSSSTLVQQLLTEFILRLGIFIPATSLVKIAIESNGDDPDREDALRCVYILAILIHQINNYDETSMRTLNRMLICVAIILFSLTTTSSKPCQEMNSFKKRIKRRLTIDYYLWCLTFAMNFVLTCTSPLYINLEHAHGFEMHTIHLLLSTACCLSLSRTMRLIGYGRLAPLITGTPLLLLDSGDGITAVKATTLFLSYFFFWCSDWRELVDWNHSMLCEAGVCELLNKEPGNLAARDKKAKHKFDEWRLEEGLDDDGWFILLDAPANLANGFRPHASESSSATPSPNNSNQEEPTTEDDNQDDEGHEQTRGNQDDEDVDEQGEPVAVEPEIEPDGDDLEDGQQMIDYSERVIYLQSRNPLLTTLAAIMLVVWK